MPSPVSRQAAAGMPTADCPAAAVKLMASSSSRVTSQPPPAIHADGGEGHPDEFKEFTDKQLQSKITRLRALYNHTPDGGEKLRRMVYRVEKELDRRRAAGLTKGEGDAEELKNSTDQDLRLKTKPLHALNGCRPDGGKKLRKSVCRVEKELDGHTAGVETGQIPSVDDPYAFDQTNRNNLHVEGCQKTWLESDTDVAGVLTIVPQVENTSNHAPLVHSEATDGGLNPFASTNLEGQGATSTNLGAGKVEPTTSTCSGKKGEDAGKKDKQSQTIGALENYLEFKMNQMQKLVGEVKERPKQEDRFTIEKCVALLEAIEELTDMEKAKALKLFKCGLNREIFMTTKSASVRLIWLKSEIYA